MFVIILHLTQTVDYAAFISNDNCNWTELNENAETLTRTEGYAKYSQGQRIGSEKI